jgi:hypothetical protein
MLNLTSQQWLGFSIYLGFQAPYRRSEMERYNVDYDDTVAALTREGVIRNGKMLPRAQAYRLFNEKFPGQLASQTHQIQALLSV